MKILHVNFVYPIGSTGKIVQEIVSCMGEENSYVCYGRGKNVKNNITKKFCTEFEAKIHHMQNRLGGLQYGGFSFATKRLIKIISSNKPDIVHLHCLNGYCVNIYQLLDFLAKNNIKTVVTHHAEFYYTGSCSHAYDCYKWSSQTGCKKCPRWKMATCTLFVDNTSEAWLKMKLSFEKFKKTNLQFIAVSPWVKYRSLQSPLVNKFDCQVILNGVNTNIFCWKDEISQFDGRIFKEDLVCLHVTASFDTKADSLKGGRYVVELAKRNPHIKFVVVATYIELNECLPTNIIIWGSAKTQFELAALYRRANFTLITSRRETFSMIVAESLCCGTPVVGFKAGGPESIAIDNYCVFVDYNNVEKLSEVLNEQMKVTIDKQLISNDAIARYASPIMVNNYIEVYKKMLN